MTPPPTMLGSNGAGDKAYQRFHEALKRIARDSTIPPDKKTLETHYAERFEESSQLPEFVSEMDDERKADSAVGTFIIALILFCAVVGYVAWKFNW